ncbi:hemicentin-2-like isoform X2 [Gigantopelta aegis]|uniref:hemicentin-2-like isoform X2 n=1 Tax=Gigantopelta aegis TaxID=1735272 RepID=UPI001B889768|nr:hemicentin-2-like isoform X2 [Gigantopelta aegis]
MSSFVVIFISASVFGYSLIWAQMDRPQVETGTYIEHIPAYFLCTALTRGGNASVKLSIMKKRPQSITPVHATNYSMTELFPGMWETLLNYSFTPDRSMNWRPPAEFDCVATYGQQKEHITQIISIAVKPRGLEVDVPVVLEAYTSVNIACEVKSGFGQFSLKWYLDGVELIGSEERTTNRDLTVNILNTLTLSLFPTHNKRKLMCKVHQGTIYSKNITHILTVQYVPVVHAPALNYTIVEGGTVSLECIVQSEPPSTISWTKDGVPIDKDSRRYLHGTTDRPSLTLLDLTIADMGIYACSATNIKGRNTSENIALDVIYLAKPDNVKYTVVVSAGEIAELTCSVKAKPKVTSFIWRHGGKTLPENGRTLFVNTSDFMTSAGDYECLAINDVGTAEPIVFKLTVREEGSPIDWSIVLAIVAPIVLLCLFGLALFLFRKGYYSKKEPQSQEPEPDQSVPLYDLPKDPPEPPDHLVNKTMPTSSYVLPKDPPPPVISQLPSSSYMLSPSPIYLLKLPTSPSTKPTTSTAPMSPSKYLNSKVSTAFKRKALEKTLFQKTLFQTTHVSRKKDSLFPFGTCRKRTTQSSCRFKNRKHG